MASKSASDPLTESDENVIAQWRIRKLIQSLSKARGYVCSVIRVGWEKMRLLEAAGRLFHSTQISSSILALQWPRMLTNSMPFASSVPLQL